MAGKVRTAVFPVAGLGTRFLPATKVMAKEMLPVVDKPLIQYAVEEARAAGIERFVFVTGRGKAALEDHFDRAVELESTLAERGKIREVAALQSWLPQPGQVFYTRQMAPLGLGHAIQCAREFVGNEPFAVLLPDDMFLSDPPCLKQMIDAYAACGGNLIAVMDVPREHTNRYGIVTPGKDDGRLVEVRGLVEKPAPAVALSTLSVAGRYVIDPGIFAHLEKIGRGSGGEIQLTDGLARMIGEAPFHGYRFQGTRFDCGDKLGFLQANIAYALARADVGPDLAAYLRQLAATL